MIVKSGETRAVAGSVAQSLMDRAGVKAVDRDASGAELMRAAGLDWEVGKVQAYFPVSGGNPAEGCEFRPVERRFALVREDTQAGLGTVGRTFQVLQNRDLFAFGDRLIEASGGRARWDQAGSTSGGRRVFATLEADQQVLSIRRWNGTEDHSGRHLLLTNQHDGRGGAIAAVFTAFRLSCSNQISAALRGRSCVRIPHVASAGHQLEQAVGILTEARGFFEQYGQVAQRLADQPMSEPEFGLFSAQMLTGLDDAERAADHVLGARGRSKALLESKGAELLQLFRSGLGNYGHDRFDALNAVTEWIDHQHARIRRHSARSAQMLGAVSKGCESAYFGHGAKIKARALHLLSR